MLFRSGPAAVFLADLGAAPETSEHMDILAVVDADGLAGQGRVGRDDDLGGASEFERDLGRGRDEPGLALQVGLEPEVLRQGARVVVTVVEVRLMLAAPLWLAAHRVFKPSPTSLVLAMLHLKH